jgi:hypothetical protein
MKAPQSILVICAAATLGLPTLAQEAPATEALAAATQAVAGRSVPNAMRVLVPDNAVAFAMTKPINDLEGIAADIAREVMPEMVEMMNADVLLGQALPPGFDVTALDRTKPFGFAVGPLSMQAEPQVFVLIPTNNPDAIKALLPTEGEFYSTRAADGYLAITRGLDYPTGTGGCALLDTVPDGIVGLSVDVEAILDSFGPMIEFGMQMARMSMADAVAQAPEAAMGVDVAALMDVYFGMAQGALDSVERFSLSVDVNETLVDIRWETQVSAGSPMADLASEGSTSAATYMPLLGDDSLAFVVGADMGNLMEKLNPFVTSALAAYPEGMREGLTQSLKSWQDAYSLFGDAVAASGGFTDEGMRFVAFFDGSDFDELMVKYESLVHETFWDSMGMHYVDTRKATLGDAELTRYTFDFDVSSLVAETDPNASAEQIAQLEAMMQAIYGSQLVTTFTKVDGLGVMTVGGGDDYLREALASAGKQSRMSPDMARLLGLARTTNPFIAYRFDVGQLMTQIMPLLEESVGAPASGMEMFEGTSLPLNFYFGIAPTTWTGGMMVDVVQASEFARMIETAGEL